MSQGTGAHQSGTLQAAARSIHVLRSGLCPINAPAAPQQVLFQPAQLGFLPHFAQVIALQIVIVDMAASLPEALASTCATRSRLECRLRIFPNNLFVSIPRLCASAAGILRKIQDDLFLMILQE
jgi:hypothetical protein